MFIIKEYYSNKFKLLNILISLFPLSIIIGNLAINLNIILVCFLGLIIYGKNIFFIEERYKYLIIIFFIYLIVITTYNNLSLISYQEVYKTHLIKSFFFLRYLILFLVVSKLIEEEKFNIKFFFFSAAFFSFLLSIDIIFQVIFGKDLIGNEITLNRPSGFFGNENIAGGYLQKFILFLLFLLIIKKQNKQNKNLYLFVLFLIFLIPILLTGNRMPILMYIGSILIYFLLEKKFLYIFTTFITIFVITLGIIKHPLSSLYKFDTQIKVLLRDIKDIAIIAPELFYNNLEYKNRMIVGSSGYLIHFNSGVQTWKKNKIFGKGIKSFKLNCKYGHNQTCNNHPHNYFIELMLDTGIIGLFLIYSLFFISFKKYINYYFSNNNLHKVLTLPFFLIIFFEFFPFRSSGSFFSTNNAVVIFLFLAFLINCQKIKLK